MVTVSGRIYRGVLVGIVAVPLVLAAACSGADKSPAATTNVRRTSTSNASTTSTTMTTNKAAVRAAYEAANRAFIDAAAIPDPDFPAIEATHTGEMLQQTRDLLRALRADGRVIRYPPNSQFQIVIESVQTEGDVSRLQFCAVDDGQRVDARTGQVISQGVVTARGDAALRLEGAAWKLAEQRFESRTEGASCD